MAEQLTLSLERIAYERKTLIDTEFQDAIRLLTTEDPSYRFWFRTLRIIHPDGKGGNNLPREAFCELRQYADELADWLKLNYPTKHWRPTGIYSREDHVLSVH